MNFAKFGNAVAKQWRHMESYPLFRVDLDGREVWDAYLISFPVGSNPIFRVREHHNCNCCRQFIRTIGNVVAVIDNKVVSIWDVTVPDEPEYQAVADALSEYVKSKQIVAPFFHYEKQVGTAHSSAMFDSKVTKFDHFALQINERSVIAPKDSIAPRVSDVVQARDVFVRALDEITLSAIDTVLDLVHSKALYRGEEHQHAVNEFRKLKIEYDAFVGNDKSAFVWRKAVLSPPSVTRIRNTSIGTLLVDLSNGADLDGAVRSFEAKVAPLNYRRTTALVTPGMVADAKKTIMDLGLTSALNRRHACPTDLSVNNVLFVDRSTTVLADTDPFSVVAAEAKSSHIRVSDRISEVTVDHFLSTVVPDARKIEVLFENEHSSNLVSLISPADPTAGQLFKWPNNFSWAYNGDAADSIKERVKNAGGSIEGDLCCRLAWYNRDDLDLNMTEPGGNQISFVGKRSPHTGGQLDVDMNAGGRTSDTPVENIFYPSKTKMKYGEYRLRVNNFTKRSNDSVGFEVEIDIEGKVYSFSYPKAVLNKQWIDVATINYTAKNGFVLDGKLPSKLLSRSKKMWGIETGQFVPINSIMLSPNHWDGNGVGNKHVFFFVDNCLTDQPARGFYNEFLREDLVKHRKVFEIVGAKNMVSPTTMQMSGLGFSSTNRASIVVKVTGASTRTMKVTF